MQLIVILYDAAIFCLQEAREHIRANDIESRSRSVSKCLAIISELQSSLNLRSGGEIAKSLDRLYDYMKMRIFEANVHQSAKQLIEIESLLENLRSAWRGITERPHKTDAPSQFEDFPATGILAVPTPAAVAQIKPFNVSI
jgi:flagellar protein FliS